MLLEKSLNAAAWGYLGSVLRLVIQVSAQVVLARLLGPAEYGLFAVAVMLVALTVFLSDVASSSLVQMREIDERQIRFAFMFQMGSATFIATLLCIVAAPVATLIGQPGSVDIIYAVAPVCLLNALGGVALAQLRRRLDFRVIQFAQTAGYFVGYVMFAIPLALWFSAGVWSLVAAALVQSIVTTAIFLRAAPHSMAPALECASSREMVRFGLTAMLTNLSNWTLMNVDRLIVARFSSMHEMGLYTTSSNLLVTPLAQLLTTLQAVVFSASARLEEGKDEQAFLPLLGIVCLVTWSMYGFVLAVPATLINALYGPNWVEAVPYMTAFSIALAAYGTFSAVTPLLWGRGAVGKEARPQFWMALLLGVVAWAAVQHSSLAVAWGTAGVYLLRCVWILIAATATFRASGRAVLVMLARIGVFVAAISLLCMLTDRALAEQVGNVQLLFVLDAMVLFSLLGAGFVGRHALFDPALTGALEIPLARLGARLRRVAA